MPTDLATLLATLDALYAEWRKDIPSPALHEQWKATLLAAYPHLREAVRELQEKAAERDAALLDKLIG